MVTEMDSIDVQELLNTLTYDEVKAKLNLSSRALNKIIKENNLEIKYKRRTRYTNTLVPVTSPFSKYDAKKATAFNKEQAKYSADNWYSNQMEIYGKQKDEAEFNLGSCIFKQAELEQKKISYKKAIDYYTHYFKVLKEAEKTKDYIGFREEEELYVLSDVKPDENYISENFILGWIESKYGLNKMLAIKEILNV